MTPKEKAIELVERMAFSCRECDYEFKAKQCALIAVDEMFLAYLGGLDSGDLTVKEYYLQMKEEIEKL